MKKQDDMTIAGDSFERLRQRNEYGAEYWSARDLQPLLGYSQWRRFEQAIERAIISCKESRNSPENHFAGAGKMVELGSGSERDLDDYHRLLSKPTNKWEKKYVMPSVVSVGPYRRRSHRQNISRQ